MIALLRRFAFFFLTNIAILALLGGVFALVGSFYPGIFSQTGGYQGLFIYAIIFGFGGSFISLFISRWMAKRAYNIQLIEATKVFEAHQKLQLVYKTVERIAKKEGIKMPEVGYYESAEPNAFATGATKNSSLVAVSTGLLNTLEEKEIEGVVGHEMAHILNGDMVTLTLLQGIMNTFVIFFAHIAAKLVASFLEKDGEENTLSYFAYQGIYMLFQAVFGFLALFVIMWFSRVREYRADLGGAKFTSKSSMIAGLRRLQSLSQLQPTEENASTSLRAFMINEPDSFFSTHPSLDNRIRALEKNYLLH